MKSLRIKQFTKATQSTTTSKDKDSMLNPIHKRYLIFQAEASKQVISISVLTVLLPPQTVINKNKREKKEEI